MLSAWKRHQTDGCQIRLARQTMPVKKRVLRSRTNRLTLFMVNEILKTGK